MQHETHTPRWIPRREVLGWSIRISFLFLAGVAPWFLGRNVLMTAVYMITALTCSSPMCLTTLVIVILIYTLPLPLHFYNFEFLLIYVLLAVHILVFVRPVFGALGKLHSDFLLKFNFLLHPFWFILILVALFRFSLKNTVMLDNMALVLLLLIIGHNNGFFRIRVSTASILGNVSLTLFFSLLGIITLEAGSRLLMGPPERNTGAYMPHHEYVFLPNPGGTETYMLRVGEDEHKPLLFEISEQGFRDRFIPNKNANEIRVLLLGDSFTWGVVEMPFTIPSQLERAIHSRYPETDISVINGGIAGGGPVQALGMLKERGLEIEPDWVILQILLVNDFDDCLLTRGRRLRSFIPIAFINTFKNQSQFPYWLEYNVRQNSRAYAELSRLTGAKELIGDSLAAFRGVSYEPLRKYPLAPHINPILDINRRVWYPELLEAFHMLIDHVVQMAAICEVRGIKFSVYCIPVRDELNAELWDYHIRMANTTCEFVPLLAIQRVEEALAGLNLDVFSVIETLVNFSSGVNDLYYLYDSHLNAKGNQVMANAILYHLERSGLVELCTRERDWE